MVPGLDGEDELRGSYNGYLDSLGDMIAMLIK